MVDSLASQPTQKFCSRFIQVGLSFVQRIYPVLEEVSQSREEQSIIINLNIQDSQISQLSIHQSLDQKDN